MADFKESERTPQDDAFAKEAEKSAKILNQAKTVDQDRVFYAKFCFWIAFLGMLGIVIYVAYSLPPLDQTNITEWKDIRVDSLVTVFVAARGALALAVISLCVGFLRFSDRLFRPLWMDRPSAPMEVGPHGVLDQVREIIGKTKE